MSRFTKCDACEKQHREDWARWFTIRIEEPRDVLFSTARNERPDLCSWECVLAYAKKRISQ